MDTCTRKVLENTERVVQRPDYPFGETIRKHLRDPTLQETRKVRTGMLGSEGIRMRVLLHG